MESRESAVLPPFGRLAAVIVEAEKEADAMQACRALASRIPKSAIQVLGPAPAPLARLRNRFRYRFLVRAGREMQLQPFLKGWIGQFTFPSRIRVRVDIDPYSFL
jgi:primosomal protein N' (replication factor Y)